MLSSTAPAHRMWQALPQFSHFEMLAYTNMRAQMLSSTVPAHRMCQTLFIVATFMDAALQPDEGSSALKCRASAQNASDMISSLYILRHWSTHRCWANRKYRACAQNVSGATHISFHFEMLPYAQMRSQVLSSTVPAHRMC